MNNNLSQAIIWHTDAQQWHTRGGLQQALVLFKKALAIFQVELPIYHERLGQIWNNIGCVYRDLGQYTAAYEAHTTALTIFEQSGPEITLAKQRIVRINLASDCLDLGHYTQAEQYLQAIAGGSIEAVLNIDAVADTGYWQVLAHLFVIQGRFDAAEAVYYQLISQHPSDDLQAQGLEWNNLGGIFLEQGHLDKALMLFKRAETLIEQACPENHPHRATVMNNLASIWQQKGQYQKAIQLYQQVAVLKETTLGRQHPSLANTWRNWGVASYAQGDLDTAQLLFERVCALDSQALGEAHPTMAQNYSNLSNIYRERQQLEKASALCQQAVAILEQAFGDTAQQLIHPLNNLASCMTELEAPLTEVETVYQRAQHLAETFLGLESPVLAAILKNRGALHLNATDADIALALFLQANSIETRQLPTNHPDRIFTLEGLAIAYFHTEQWAESLQRLEAAALICDALSTAGDARKPRIRNLKSVVLARLDRFDSAAYELHQAIVENNALPPSTQQAAMSVQLQNNLARLLEKQEAVFSLS